FPDRLVSIQAAILIDIADLRRLPQRKRARVRRDFAGDDAEERRLAGAVWADHSDNAASRKRERQILKEDLVAEPFRQAVGFQHDVSEARSRWNIDLQVVGIFLLLCVQQLFIAGDT